MKKSDQQRLRKPVAEFASDGARVLSNWLDCLDEARRHEITSAEQFGQRLALVLLFPLDSTKLRVELVLSYDGARIARSVAFLEYDPIDKQFAELAATN